VINYTYKAQVLRVVDGDTIDARVDLGFNVDMNIRFRMIGYDAPETWRPKSEEERALGKKATKALENLISGKTIIIKSNKFGKYRWLGEVFLPDNPISVNQQMIDLGHTKNTL